MTAASAHHPGQPGEAPEPDGGDDLLPGAIEIYLERDVPVCTPTDTAADLRALLTSRPWPSVADVAVCSGPRLVGLVPVERALAAPDGVTAADLMDDDPPVVAVHVDQERAAWKAVRHGESSLAVCDEDGRFLGLVPPVRLLGVLLVEHEEDLARLGGYLASTAGARHATEEPLRDRLWHRLPWLLLGLLGSAVAAWLVGGFEAELARDVRLAFFIPGVVYMADAVGTQTEALVVRGLSVGMPLRRVYRLEAVTGLLVGLIVAAAALPAVWWALGSARLAVAVALSLVAACSIATVVAMLLPWLLHRRGLDPAFGSGPLATVVQDLLSLLVYFGVVVLIVT